MSVPERTGRLWRLVESPFFTALVLAVILANAVVLGMQTYPEFERDHGDTLDLLNNIFLGFFVVEVSLRIAAFGRRPQDFFRGGWNLFDFAVVAMAFVPGIRGVVDAAAGRAADAGRARRARAAGPQAAGRGSRQVAAAARQHGAADGADHLRVRDVRLAALRRRSAAGLGEHRHGDALAVRDPDSGGLPALHGAGDGDPPVGVGLLRDLRRRRGLHRRQRPDRDRAELDGGGTRARAPAPLGRGREAGAVAPAPVLERIAILRAALEELEEELAEIPVK